MSKTSSRSLCLSPGFAVSSPLVRLVEFCSSRERGFDDNSSSSSSSPPYSLSSSLSDSISSVRPSGGTARSVFRLFALRSLASTVHAGAGCSRSNCLRSRLVYSLPLTTSSASVNLSFRSRSLPARDTLSRSSSLSSQADAKRAAESFETSCSSSDEMAVVSLSGASLLAAAGPVSRKKSYFPTEEKGRGGSVYIMAHTVVYIVGNGY